MYGTQMFGYTGTRMLIVLPQCYMGGNATLLIQKYLRIYCPCPSAQAYCEVFPRSLTAEAVALAAANDTQGLERLAAEHPGVLFVGQVGPACAMCALRSSERAFLHLPF